ncbi:hypothetical protein ACHAW6_001621 [Cyclotella cf. meneghiniana]
MDQFLDFLREHSSTIALVLNLHTGYISPQYHVVFDDKSKTVFHDDKTSEELDKICEELFTTSQDCYVEEEFNDDGILVYTSLPLDEVWLSEPQHCERREVMDKQCNRVQRQQELDSKEVKCRLEQSKDSPPDLVESDMDSDDDNSVPDCSDFELGGDEIEGD